MNCSCKPDLQQEVGDALVSAAGSEHQGCESFRRGGIDTDARLQQQVSDVIVTDICSVHQRSPAADVLPIQIHISPE